MNLLDPNPPNISAIDNLVPKLRQNLTQNLIDRGALIDRLLIALLSQNAILLEGGPGRGKSWTLRLLSTLLSASFRHIWLSLDLSPTEVIDQWIQSKEEEESLPERAVDLPQIVLCEDIDRASARVQNTILGIVRDREIRVGSKTWPLPAATLITAIQSGGSATKTNPLTPSQLDHFPMKVLVGFYHQDEQRQILDASLNEFSGRTLPTVASFPEIQAAQRAALRLPIPEELRSYIVEIVIAAQSRGSYGNDLALNTQQGPSARAVKSLAMASQARAFSYGRSRVQSDDINAIAKDVLRHRVSLTPEARTVWLDSDHFIDHILATLEKPEPNHLSPRTQS